MVKIGYIKGDDYLNDDVIDEQNCYENWFNYDWVLGQLSKDWNIEGIDRIGFTDDGYEVFIVTDDYKISDIPHFHYRKKEKGKECEFHTCIRFDKPEYYHHIGNEDILNNEQKGNLINFLMAKPKYFDCSKTNWEELIMCWNHQNDYKVEINEDLKMPDYRELK